MTAVRRMAEGLPPVGEVTPVGSALGGVIVARVLEVREHPDADRVRLVDGPFAGEGYTWWIVRQESTGLEGYASEGLATGADPRFLGPAQ